MSENSEIVAETSRAINSESSSQMSGKFEEMKWDFNSHIFYKINSAIGEKVIPSIKNAIESQKSAKNTTLDRIRVTLVTFAPRGTFGQMDRINKMLARRLRMLRKTSPD